jgi:hypothetical protein
MKAVNKEWQMCSVGAVFGMGFDTATEAANHAFGRKSLARPMITKTGSGPNLVMVTMRVFVGAMYRSGGFSGIGRGVRGVAA